MKEVFVLLRRIYDPYGCLEDNEMEIMGIFTTKELAEENKQIKENADKRKRFDYWVDNYELNKFFHLFMFFILFNIFNSKIVV